jgi:uncharacterized protein (TIGR00369 family)
MLERRDIPQDPAFESRVRGSFARQRFMTTLGARLARVEPDEVDIELAMRDDLVQQHGFLHAGVVASVADSACGYAALSLMPAGAAVLSVEFKVNLLAPAAGERFVARGRIIRPGKTVTVCWGDVTAYARDAEKVVATMVGTMMNPRPRSRRRLTRAFGGISAGSPSSAPSRSAFSSVSQARSTRVHSAIGTRGCRGSAR